MDIEITITKGGWQQHYKIKESDLVWIQRILSVLEMEYFNEERQKK